jgi:DNA-directed RNA polymerase sigma subunit (sigma70/sigma32)
MLTEEDRNKLFEDNKHIATQLANKYYYDIYSHAAGVDDHFFRHELVQASLLGLLEAAKFFKEDYHKEDGDRNKQFIGLARTYIKNSIRSSFKKENAYVRTYSVTLDAQVKSDSDTTHKDLLHSTECVGSTLIENKMCSDLAHKVLEEWHKTKELKRFAVVLEAYLLNNESLSNIATQLKMTKQGVALIKDEALGLLRHEFGQQGYSVPKNTIRQKYLKNKLSLDHAVKKENITSS